MPNAEVTCTRSQQDVLKVQKKLLFPIIFLNAPASGVRFRVKAPVTRRPPHRPVREDFPHTVPRLRFFYQIFNQTGDTPFGV